MAKKIKMLRPGTFTAMSGKSYSFSESDLRATAAAYDPAIFAAPIVKGHPEHDAPAFGRIYAVDFSDGHLNGTPGKVDPAFTEEVNSGRFDNVSLSLYPPDHPANPVPGVYYPRHLGFLGAMPPAVKGLGQVNLSEDEGLIHFAELDLEDERNARAKKWGIGIKEGGNASKPSKYSEVPDEEFGDPVNFRYPLDEKHIHAALSYWGRAKDREQYTAEEVKIITRRILAAAKKHGVDVDKEKFDFAEPSTKKGAPMDMKKRAQFCADCQDQVCTGSCPTGAISMNADKGAIIDPAKCNTCMKCCDACMMMQGPVYGMQVANYAERDRNTLKAENVAFAEELVKAGKVLPAEKVKVVAILDFCAGLTSDHNIEFGEGDAKKTQPALEIFKDLLKAQPKKIEFGEIVTGEEANAKTDIIPADLTKFI